MKKKVTMIVIILACICVMAVQLIAKPQYTVEPQVTIEPKKTDLQMVMESYERIIAGYQNILTQAHYAQPSENIKSIEDKLDQMDSKLDLLIKKIERIEKKLNIESSPENAPAVSSPKTIPSDKAN